MAAPGARNVSPKNIVVDAVLVVAAFALFFWLATTHVPSDDPNQVHLWSAYCAACMTGVFWIAVGSLWLGFLQMTVIPLVFALLVVGVAAVSDALSAGRLTARRAPGRCGCF